MKFISQMSMVTKFVLWSLVLLILVVITLATTAWNNQNDSTPDFNHWQSQYKEIAYALASDPSIKAATQQTPITVNQVTVGQFAVLEGDGSTQLRVDRCESCHVGLVNPQMTAENIIKFFSPHHDIVATENVAAYLSQPEHKSILGIVEVLGAHPGTFIQGKHSRDLGVIKAPAFSYGVVVDHNVTAEDTADYGLQKSNLQRHPFPTFGCTTCHYGSGRAIVEHVAHGDPDHWLSPLLPAKYMEAACAQCHTTSDAKTLTFQYLPQMTTIARGEKLFKDYACYGCHKIEGFSSGNIGPDLTFEGRAVTTITIQHQIWDPRYKVGACVMPYFFADRLHNTDASYQNVADEVVDQRTKTEVAASIDNPTIVDSLKEHGYIPDAAHQTDVDALVTFVASQTGQNFSQSPSARMSYVTAYDLALPTEVPVTAAEGKKLFDMSGCYGCHHIGDPSYKGPPELDPKGKGGLIGPPLTGVASRHSREWLIAHYAHPQDFVPASIMPEFPFSNSQRAALAEYDLTLKPANKAARPMSATQDMPTGDLAKEGAVTPAGGYMTR